MAFSDHTQDGCMLTPREKTESNICWLTEGTLKAGGHCKAGSVFLIKKGACAVVENIALHLERCFKHAPISVASAFMDVWKQTLVIRVPSF